MTKNNLFLIYGEENFFIEQTVRELKTKYVDPALEAFSLDIITEQNRDVNQLINSLQMIPSFAPQRLVLVYDPFFLTARKTTEEETADESSALDSNTEALLYSALENIPEGAVAAFVVHGKVDQRRKLFKFFQKQATVQEFKSFASWDKTSVLRWIMEYLQKKNFTIDSAAADFLVETSGMSLTALVNELDKIMTYALGKTRIEFRDVEAVASQGGLNIYALSGALQKYDIPEVMRLIMALLKDGETPQGLLGFVASQIKTLLTLKELQTQKKSPAEISGFFRRLPPNILRQILADLPKHNLQTLKNVYYELQQADFQMKTGQMDAKNALICALAGLA